MQRNRHYTLLFLALLCILVVGAFGYWKKHRIRTTPISQCISCGVPHAATL